ncbi:MAG: glucosaminidase domain-containing protein [Clostridiales bacterium]|nr:glucosaminidase domain-containing protein [Clostridiales bacterium]
MSQTAASTSAAPTAPAATTAPPAGASPNAPAAAAKTPGLDTPVLSSAAATLSAAQAWAKGKGSTDTFVSLAQIYWENAGAHGAVNPQIAYAQSAFETSYGKFGGLLDESFCNPCGMKTANGGSDTDKNDSQKFANWTDGVNAHLDHIALYGGAAGYPRANTTDPRHFASLYGTGKTVETLSKSWCPGNANYADTLIKVVNEMGTINPADVKTPEEITVDNAIADGILTDKNYWLNVLNGTQAANKDYVKIVLDNAHKKING